MCVFFCNLAVVFFLAPGQPLQHGADYFFNDHGDLIPVSYVRFLYGRATWVQGFALCAAVFYSAGAIVNRTALVRGSQRSPKEKSETPSARW